VIDKSLPLDFSECVVDTSIDTASDFGGNRLDAPSDISNQSSIVSDSSSDDHSSSESSEYYENEIEQPHRTMGLIFFDFIRFVAIFANVRHVNTQIVPVFLASSQMEVLHVALR